MNKRASGKPDRFGQTCGDYYGPVDLPDEVLTGDHAPVVAGHTYWFLEGDGDFRIQAGGVTNWVPSDRVVSGVATVRNGHLFAVAGGQYVERPHVWMRVPPDTISFYAGGEAYRCDDGWALLSPTTLYSTKARALDRKAYVAGVAAASPPGRGG